MDKLEEYLDQVCRRIGGPKTLRQHIRQELREHLRDAVAEHRKAGLSEAEAQARALNDFGKPDEVRSELEATHGHRLMAVAIDKAIEWKEKTMKAKWLWATWAYLALLGLIALEVLWILFAEAHFVPRMEGLNRRGWLDFRRLDDAGVAWMPTFLIDLGHSAQYWYWWFLGIALIWGLFEWRVRSENKSFMRVSALGTAAVALMVLTILTAGCFIITFCLGLPAAERVARPFALNQVSRIDEAMFGLDAALARKNWAVMKDDADKASSALEDLAKGVPALPALSGRNQPPTIEELQARVKEGGQSLAQAQQAILQKDAGQLEAALRSFQKSFDLVREAAHSLSK